MKLHEIYRSEIWAINMTLEWMAEFMGRSENSDRYFAERRLNLLKDRNRFLELQRGVK